jgi:hypothetical protein
MNKRITIDRRDDGNSKKLSKNRNNLTITSPIQAVTTATEAPLPTCSNTKPQVEYEPKLAPSSTLSKLFILFRIFSSRFLIPFPKKS